MTPNLVLGESDSWMMDSAIQPLAASRMTPAHAHDAEEWYLVLSGRAEWQIDDEVYQAEEGTIFHHPPTAGHRMLTFENPLLAIWIWTGAILAVTGLSGMRKSTVN